MNFDVLAVNANPLLNLVHGGDFAPGAVNRVAAMAVAAEGKGGQRGAGVGATGRWRVFPPAVRQVNPVGCGDCYLAGLAHGWLSGLP